MLPTWAEERDISGYFFFRRLARTSRLLSWLPIQTRVFSISFLERIKWTVTSDRAAIPSLRAGTRTMPSARTRDMSMPAPRETGVAIKRPSTIPTLTRRNSSRPMVDATCRESVAFMIAGAGAGCPCQAWITGLIKRSKVRTAETGYPGIPTTGFPCTIPRITGFPGRIWIPCTKTSPRSRSAWTVKSCCPAEDPALTTTRSDRPRALRMFSFKRPRSSGTIACLTASPPHS